ncbi:MAG: phage minor head protein [Balneolales bacterium]
MPDIPDLSGIFNRTPEQIVEQFRAKGNVVSWNWREVWQEAHARAFTVAKAVDMDVLNAIRNEVDSALANGTTYRDFQKELEPTLKKLGWWGRREEVDPQTGEVKEVQLGSPWRLKNIYRTNLSSSYSAGRYKTQIATAERRPWWIYRTAGDANVRPSHDEMAGTVLRYDDPFWAKNYPPNDWGCRCGVDTLSDRQLESRGITPTTGGVKSIAGDGWDYNPAQAAWQPDTDETRAEFAKEYVNAALDGPGLGYMYSRTARTLEDLADKGLSNTEIAREMRGALVQEEFPVGVLQDSFRNAISAQGHSVFMTAETLGRNILRNPGIGLDEFRGLQNMWESAQLVVKEGASSIAFYLRTDDGKYKVVKATTSGEKMYLSSLRSAGARAVATRRETGNILKDEL